ncbi:MAG: hypothetical protein HOK41_01110 [Nitrospina sp.]|jgi:Ca2+-binding EF-hand superfamily protein|nr:hypothetical protein [Nitrospina sp.]MBT6718286.1 hypothetical protein [Nitrospina sp.]
MVEGTGSLGQTALSTLLQRSQQNFKLADTDKSGGLNKDEVQIRADQTGKDQKILDNFESIDINGNGEVSQDEIQAFRIAEGGNQNPEQLLSQLQNIFGQSGINTGSIVDFLSNQQSKDNNLTSLLRDSTNLDALIESRVNEIFTSAGVTGSSTEPGDLTSQVSTFI